ncbi:MAG: transglutaminase family protein [Candidatus Promineofilum sp.]|nr:transglutaminase family protein [Promineifilum sp.]
MTEWLFQDELRLAELNVPRAALHVARAIAYPQLNVASYMAGLHDLSESAAERIAFDQPVVDQAEQLAAFLFGECGFRGNADAYNDPRNSYLNEVLDRRLGLPITLSVIYVDIAHRLGLPAYGIGLPGHYIVGIHGAESTLWLDPFHGGRRLDLADCAELIHLAIGYEGPLEAGWFEPLPPRDTLARLLNNLRTSYVQAGAWSQAAAAIRLLRQTQPEVAEHVRDLGLVYYQQRRLPQAAHYLDVYLQRAPQAADAQLIRDGMKDLLDEWVALN